METIRPGIITSDGNTIYPTGIEWIIAFAIRGIPWAIKELERIDYFKELSHKVEKQLFDWESWDCDFPTMQFYEVILKIRIGNNMPGSKFPVASINFETGELLLYRSNNEVENFQLTFKVD